VLIESKDTVHKGITVDHTHLVLVSAAQQKQDNLIVFVGRWAFKMNFCVLLRRL